MVSMSYLSVLQVIFDGRVIAYCFEAAWFGF